MKRALSFFALLLTFAVVEPAVAADRPSCAYASSIENWRVRSPRAMFADVRVRDAQGVFIVTFASEGFARWPKNTALRVEARSECLASGDSMFFTFPPPSASGNSGDSEERCVVRRVERWSPRAVESDWPKKCRFEQLPNGHLVEHCD